MHSKKILPSSKPPKTLTIFHPPWLHAATPRTATNVHLSRKHSHQPWESFEERMGILGSQLCQDYTSFFWDGEEKKSVKKRNNTTPLRSRLPCEFGEVVTRKKTLVWKNSWRNFLRGFSCAWNLNANKGSKEEVMTRFMQRRHSRTSPCLFNMRLDSIQSFALTWRVVG